MMLLPTLDLGQSPCRGEYRARVRRVSRNNNVGKGMVVKPGCTCTQKDKGQNSRRDDVCGSRERQRWRGWDVSQPRN